MTLIQKIKIAIKKNFSYVERVIVELKSISTVENTKRLVQDSQIIETNLLSDLASFALVEGDFLDAEPTKLRLLPKPLYFLHIPKTAGSSLRYWLEDLFALSDVSQLYTLSDVEKDLPFKINDYWFYTGHLGFALHELLAPNSDVDTFTWLRDPIKREVSQYQYIRHTKDYQIYMSPSPELMSYIDTVCNSSLSELCQSDAYLGYYDNLQTRMLAGLVLPQSYGSHDDDSDQSVENCNLIYETTNIKNIQEFAADTTQRMHQEKVVESLRNCQRKYLDSNFFLEKAKINLAKLSHFGLCEWMQPSIDLFCYRVGLPPQTFNFRLNQTEKGGEPLSEDELFWVQKSNHYDNNLYAFAKQEFRNRICDMWKDCVASNVLINQSFTDTKLYSQLVATETADIDTLLENWDSLELRNTINQFLKISFQRHHHQDKRKEQLNICFFNAGDAVFLSGWHPRVYCKVTKIWYRWAGPGTESSIFLPIESDRNYRITFKVIAYVNDEILQSIRLIVGGKAISLEQFEAIDSQGNNQYIFLGMISSHLISASDAYTELVFKTQGTDRIKLPENLFSNSYNASFALHNITLQPMPQ